MYSPVHAPTSFLVSLGSAWKSCARLLNAKLAVQCPQGANVFTAAAALLSRGAVDPRAAVSTPVAASIGAARLAVSWSRVKESRQARLVASQRRCLGVGASRWADTQRPTGRSAERG